jgi:hypothetical protein
MGGLGVSHEQPAAVEAGWVWLGIDDKPRQGEYPMLVGARRRSKGGYGMPMEGGAGDLGSPEQALRGLDME